MYQDAAEFIGGRKVHLALFLTAILVLTLSQPAAAVMDVDVAVVNLQSIVDAHPEAENLEEEMQAELMELEQEFQAQLQALDEDDEEALRQLQQQLQMQAEMIQQQKMQEMMEILRPELDEFRENEGYDLILVDESVLSGGEEVTEEVIDFITQ